MEPASSMGKSPRKLLGTIKNELNNERHLSSERLKTLLEQIERLVNSKGIDVIILNQGAELFKTALHKTEDPAVLEYCLKSAENPNFKYNKVAKDRMLTFVRKHYDDNNLTKVFAFWPTYFAPSLIVIFVEHVLPKLDNQQKEELYKLISHAFQYGENDHLRNIAFRLLIGLKIKIPIETNSKSVSRFIKFISTMRDEKNAEWATYWKVLVKNCGIQLHSHMEILNSLLDVVEHAFRNTTDISDRLLGFDCWKVLIDNASLDMNHLCSKKQLKLLLIPLKAKLSRQETVVIKRFSLFVYLMEKLQENAIVCLDDFLEFSFGNVGANSDPNKCGQGRTVTRLWKPSIDVLETILGEERPNFKLRKLVTGDNIYEKHRIVVNSVFEASAMIEDDRFEGEPFKEQLRKHLWTLLITTILSNKKEEEVNVCLEYILDVASKREANKSDSFYTTVWFMLADIFSHKPIDSLKKFQYFLRILKNCFDTESVKLKSRKVINVVCEALETSCISNNEKLNEAVQFVLSSGNLLKNVFIWHVWATVGGCVIESVTISELNIQEKYFKFIMWPVLHKDVQYYTSIDCVRKTWTALFVKLKNVKKTEVLEEFKKNDAIQKDAKYFVQDIAFCKKRNLNVENALRVLQLIESMLTRETRMAELKVTTMILNYFIINDLTNVLKYFEHSANVETLCNCIKMTTQFQLYNVLNSLALMLNNVTDEKVRGSFRTHLSQHFANLLIKDRKISEIVRATLDELVNMLNYHKEIKTKKRKSVGKDNLKVQILSPTKIQINSTSLPTTTRSKKIVDSAKKIPSIPLDEESASKFVLIESKVTVEPSKLSDHQKEMMKKRRDDIPALYEDLTMSQSSNDVFTQKVLEKGQSEEAEKSVGEEEKIVQEKKVKTPEKKDKTPEKKDKTPEKKEKTPEKKEKTPEKKEKSPEKKKREREENVEDTNERNKDEENPTNQEKEEEEKKKRIDRELRRIQMNIVGAEEYNNSARTRTSRGKVDANLGTSDFVFYDETDSNQTFPDGCGNNNTEKKIEQEKEQPKEPVRSSPKRAVKHKHKIDLSLKKKIKRRKSFDSKTVIQKMNVFLNKSTDQLRTNEHNTSSEDIIESTQEIDYTKQKIAEIILNEIGNLNIISETNAMAVEDTITQVSTNDTATCESTDSIVVDEEPEPEEPELIEPEQIVANNDTDSVKAQDESIKEADKTETELEDLMQNSPSTPMTKRSLPSSPVTGDTPNRTDEFLNDTLNISPIQTVSVSSPPAATTEEKTSPRKEKPTSNRNERSRRLLSLVKENLKRIHKQPLPVSMSPSIGNIRMKKLMFNCPQIENQIEMTTQTSTNDVLTFSRDVPSPLALPKNSILKGKRKHSEVATDDFSSPCPKRKRVNFSDPILTSEKLIFKDANEFVKENDKPVIEGVGANEFDELFVAQNCDIEDALYPDLINCKEEVSVVFKDVEPEVTAVLRIKGIVTIGDLAGLSKSELVNMPFKESEDVVALLSNYYQNQQILEEDREISFEEQIVIDTNEDIVSSPPQSPIIEEPESESNPSSVDEFIESLKENPEKRSDFLSKLKDTNVFVDDELQVCFAPSTTDTETSVQTKNYDELFSIIKNAMEDDVMNGNHGKLLSDILDLMRVKLPSDDVFNLLSDGLRNVFNEAVNKK